MITRDIRNQIDRMWLLRERMLLGTVSDGEITIDPSKIEGLDIRFVEKK